jgi:hypothetical protein
MIQKKKKKKKKRILIFTIRTSITSEEGGVSCFFSNKSQSIP